MGYIKQFFLAVLALVLFALSSPVSAQETGNWNRPITASGSAALMIAIEGFAPFNVTGPGFGQVPVPIGHYDPTLKTKVDSMTSITGMGVKYFVVDNIAVRVLLGFAQRSVKQFDTSSFAPATTIWGVGVGGEYHFRPLYSVTPYMGLLITNESSSSDEPTNQDITYSGHTFGVNLFTGFDWFVTRGIAIGAEGGLRWATSGFTQKLKSTETEGPNVSSIALAMDGLVHVVVYF